MDPVIMVKNAGFSYEDSPILKDVNLCVKKGDYVGIVGSNGSGKSTLLKLLLGILSPKTGSIIISAKKIGYVPQVGLSVKSDFPATVREVVMLNLYSEAGLFKPFGKAHKVMADKALEQVGMTSYSNRLISKLSGGQQQRVLIAKALVNQPDMLILDEPIAGIDAESENSFYSLLRQLNKKMGITIIMVTHNVENVEKDMNKIYEIKNNLVILERGSLTECDKEGKGSYAAVSI